MSPIRAVNELVNGAGTQFDGEVVRAFLRALKSQAIDLREVDLAARTAPAQEQHVDEDQQVPMLDEPVAVVDPEFRRAADVVDPSSTNGDDEDEFPAAA
jgi:hypothetical protein